METERLQELKEYSKKLDSKELFKSLILESKTGELVSIIRNIKNSCTINKCIDNNTLKKDDGLISPTGTFTLTQKILELDALMNRSSISYENYLIGKDLQSLNLVELIFQDKLDKLQDCNEFIIWQGSKDGVKFADSLPSQPNDYPEFLKLSNGFLHHLHNSPDTNYYSGNYYGELTQENGYKIVDGLIGQLPEKLTSQEDLVMFMSFKNYREYIKGLINASQTTFEEVKEQGWKITNPGTNVKVVATPGLVGSNYIVLTTANNLYIGWGEGCDINFDSCETECECGEVDVITFKYSIGTQITYPEYCYVYTGKIFN